MEGDYPINPKMISIITVLVLIIFFLLSIYFTSLQARKIGFYEGCKSIGLDVVYDNYLKESKCDNFTRLQQERYVSDPCIPTINHTLLNDMISSLNKTGDKN